MQPIYATYSQKPLFICLKDKTDFLKWFKYKYLIEICFIVFIHKLNKYQDLRFWWTVCISHKIIVLGNYFIKRFININNVLNFLNFLIVHVN